MGKRIIHREDENRTRTLNQAELYVEQGKGDHRHYFVRLQDPEIDGCPICSSDAIKVQDLFSRTYSDLIIDGTSESVISLIYNFYKYRCLNSECRHIFAKEISFASKYDNVTYRLENRIANMVMNGLSYSQICSRLQDSVSRQAVGQIFNRWVHKKDDLRRIRNSPSCMAVLSGKTDKEQFTVILNLDNGIRVYDIFLGVDSDRIASFLFQTKSILSILSNCDPVITYAIRDNLPGALYVVPVEYWFDLVTLDFAEYAHDILRWSPVPNKDTVIMLPDAEIGLYSFELERLLSSRPILRPPHADYNKLKKIISRTDERWVYNELVEWMNSVDLDFRKRLCATALQLEYYRPELEAHVQHEEIVPDRLHFLTSRLEQLIAGQRTFSEEVLRARVLYSIETSFENWKGVPIEDVIAALEKMSSKNGDKYYEYE